jgi:hypothetical protein
MNRSKNFSTAFVFFILISIYSCSDTNMQDIESSNRAKKLPQSETLLEPFTCNVDGEALVFKGQTCSYTYTSNLPLQSITWSVVSGNITLISGQNSSTAVFQFASNFTGGQIKARGVESGQGDICERTETIGVLPDLTIELTSVTQNPGGPEVPHPSTYTYTATTLPAGYTYNWYVFGQLSPVSTTNVFSTRIPCGVEEPVYCTVQNSCSPVQTSNTIAEIGECPEE